MNLDRLCNIIRMTEAECFAWCRRELRKAGYRVRAVGGDYMVATPARGTSSGYCMVAHLDTIPRLKGVDLVREGVYLRNREGVLGADDRAGVYAIFELIRTAPRGELPYVIFTTGEETGGTGVKRLIRDGAINSLLDSVRLFLEIDRQGGQEYVYYSDELPAEVAFIAEDYGFVEGFGSYSDVADLTEAYRIPHLNLAAGYYRQHSKHETLNLAELDATIYRVRAMLADIDPPAVLVPVPRPKPKGRFYVSHGGRPKNEPTPWYMVADDDLAETYGALEDEGPDDGEDYSDRVVDCDSEGFTDEDLEYFRLMAEIHNKP